jgi:hypothetical protein
VADGQRVPNEAWECQNCQHSNLVEFSYCTHCSDVRPDDFEEGFGDDLAEAIVNTKQRSFTVSSYLKPGFLPLIGIPVVLLFIAIKLLAPSEAPKPNTIKIFEAKITSHYWQIDEIIDYKSSNARQSKLQHGTTFQMPISARDLASGTLLSRHRSTFKVALEIDNGKTVWMTLDSLREWDNNPPGTEYFVSYNSLNDRFVPHRRQPVQ